jgi:phosphoglycerate dehydrogenase-like enzyme
MENVYITPHMGGHTPKHWERLAEILAQNIKKIENGEHDSLTNKRNDPNAPEAAQ